jgi:hypothetical protein
MKNWNKICGFIAIFFLNGFFCVAQSASINTSTPKPGLILTPFYGMQDKDNFNVLSPVRIVLINPDYTKQHFGFFCKKELLMEKTTKIPIRLRLGSVEQCNYLEGYRSGK